jgi:hypothetical protein
MRLSTFFRFAAFFVIVSALRAEVAVQSTNYVIIAPSVPLLDERQRQLEWSARIFETLMGIKAPRGRVTLTPKPAGSAKAEGGAATALMNASLTPRSLLCQSSAALRQTVFRRHLTLSKLELPPEPGASPHIARLCRLFHALNRAIALHCPFSPKHTRHRHEYTVPHDGPCGPLGERIPLAEAPAFHRMSVCPCVGEHGDEHHVHPEDPQRRRAPERSSNQ